MNRTPSPVASWTFSRLSAPVTRYDETTLEQMVTLAVEALDVVAGHELLVPERVVLQAWREPFGAAESAARPSADSTPAEFAAVTGDLRQPVLDLARTRGAFPEEIHFSGPGAVYDADGGRSEVDDLVHLYVSAFYEVSVRLVTHVDIWLPHDLRAVEQWDLHEANAPRLRAALAALAELPDVEESHVDKTKYAEVASTEVLNHIDYFGRAVPVLDQET
jgi:hypothetical protein